MRHFVCGDHTEEQYSNKGRMYVQKAVVNKVLSREWKDLRIRLALDMALCTIPTICLSHFNLLSIITPRFQTQSTLANIWSHIPYAVLEHPGLWWKLDTVQTKHSSLAICSCQVRLHLCSRPITIIRSCWGTLTLYHEYSLILSAYNLHLRFSSSKISQMSLMINRNKVGPSTVPCGTPLAT